MSLQSSERIARLPSVGILRKCAAFSLVEVTLALGIIAFAFVAIVGLIPVGLSTARDAMETSVRSQIVQRVVSDVKQTDLQDIDGGDLSFDDQANPVSVGNADKIYDVRVALANVVLPSAPANADLQRVTITVVNNPGNQSDPFGGSIRKKVYSAFVARSSHVQP
jgi:uncharacterized protein (TIGR02598 family)